MTCLVLRVSVGGQIGVCQGHLSGVAPVWIYHEKVLEQVYCQGVGPLEERLQVSLGVLGKGTDIGTGLMEWK